MTEDELRIVRGAFARQIVGVSGVGANPPLEAAFAAVKRDDFLGPGPWMTLDRQGNHIRMPADDPVYAYQDVVFALAPGRGVNNGEPSLHARMLVALAPEPGHHVIHVGAGTGYYSAIIAHLVGSTGKVTAVEIDPNLASAARRNLAGFSNVTVVTDDGWQWPLDGADRVYANFCVGRPFDRWVEGLNPGGRLVFPLGVPTAAGRGGGPRHAKLGAAFMVERRARGFSASWVCPAYFVWAEGAAPNASDEELARLESAFRSGAGDFVKSLIWGRSADPGRCWFWASDWALGYDEPGAGD